MSYAICRMEKMKSHDLKGMQFHNQRERESKTNPDIDKERSHLNYDLVNLEKIDYNKRVKEIIESQKTGTRKIRKDAVMVNELLITSDKSFFERLDPQQHEKFFKESYKLFAERYGQQNIAYATVHNDEKTPHMHIGVVPMRDGKLQSKNVFNRQELQWIQDEFPKHMQKQGFDLQRGEKGSDREHLKTQEFKAKTLNEKVMTLENDLQAKQMEKREIEDSIKDIEGRLSDLGRSIDHVEKVDKVEVKEKGGFIRSKTLEIGVEDFESIKTLAKSSEWLRSENKGLEIKNARLEQEKKDLARQRDMLGTKNMDLQKKNSSLEKENDFLKKTLERVKELYLERIPELAKMIGYVKARLLTTAKEKILTRYFSGDEEIKGAKEFIDKEQERKNSKKQTRKKERNYEPER
ncbi:MobV family relaxase [Priestia endophytica]|uniref:MobV family relaxase n=1 Tax=Priestia endophytica TaxID=135735 RepID=UPI002280DF05|nr:MobV family relaxase [Priestia endophytica]MCY8235537.1 plasmid recombination protein [Priestia endophytica]